jgi:anti-anti-sigma regulatory factor
MTALATVQFADLFTAENLLSFQAFLMYALAFLGVLFWIVALLILKGAARKSLKQTRELSEDLYLKVMEAHDLSAGLHDGFSTLSDEFKFFKEKVLVKMTSNSRLLEGLPRIAEQIAQIQEAPPVLTSADQDLTVEVERLEKEAATKDERIRSLEREMENFHRIIEEKTLEAQPESSAQDADSLRRRRETLDTDKEAFEANSDKIKAEIQAASDRLRKVQEETREAREALEAEKQSLEDERRALEEEKAELAEMGGLPVHDAKEGPDEAIIAERDHLREDVERLQRLLAQAQSGETDSNGESEAPLIEAAAPAMDSSLSETTEPFTVPPPPPAEETRGWGAVLAGEKITDETPEELPGDGAAEEEPEPPADEPDWPPPEAPSEEPAEDRPEEPAPEEPVHEEKPHRRDSEGVPVPFDSKGVKAKKINDILVVEIQYDDMKRPEAQELIDLIFGITEEKSDRVLLDCSKAAYINSSGMSAVTKIAVERNCQIVLTSPDILKIIDLMGFLPLLNINESYEEAMSAFADEE